MKNVINIPFVKNWFKFLCALFKPFDSIKWQEKSSHCRSKRWSHDHSILLFIKNIIKYDVGLLSRQRQKVLIHTFYNILVIIKLVHIFIVSSGGILVNSEPISSLPMKTLLSWCTIFLAKAKESFTVN